MSKKGLKSTIDDIEAKEETTSRFEEKVEKLSLLVEKQKKIISEQTSLIEQQKEKLGKMVDLPDDIRELRELIGAQRAQIKEKEMETENAKGLLAQAQKELELTLNRMNPTQIKVEAALETIGKLKEEIAQKNSEIMVKNETLKTLANKLKEAQTVTKGFEEQYGKENEELKKLLNELKIKQVQEKQDLKSEISKLTSQILDQKLQFQEKMNEAKDMAERYNELVDKVGESGQRFREFNEKIKSLEGNIADLKQYKKETYTKLNCFEKLKGLMEEDTLFRAFFLIEEIGHITLEDLKAAVGTPIVVVKKNVQRLQDAGIVEMDEQGKIHIKRFEVE